MGGRGGVIPVRLRHTINEVFLNFYGDKFCGFENLI